MVVAAGFKDFKIVWRGDVYAGIADSKAPLFGTLGINFCARKPES